MPPFRSYTIQVSTSASFGTLLVNSTTLNSFYAMTKNLPAGKVLLAARSQTFAEHSDGARITAE
jgi:hypothetical protein